MTISLFLYYFQTLILDESYASSNLIRLTSHESSESIRLRSFVCRHSIDFLYITLFHYNFLNARTRIFCQSALTSSTLLHLSHLLYLHLRKTLYKNHDHPHRRRGCTDVDASEMFLLVSSSPSLHISTPPLSLSSIFQSRSR